ncbi:hypothetical protein PR048_007806 [Dryococelus australis]|uniref:Uncharacterized protein n=1 Tax=Dryococelus australis TaxID=614101 RepID=A0ABQ9HVA4_9NEOP|nr:hypothetical protein PR048_007806 [Dryococelus australis]
MEAGISSNRVDTTRKYPVMQLAPVCHSIHNSLWGWTKGAKVRVPVVHVLAVGAGMRKTFKTLGTLERLLTAVQALVFRQEFKYSQCSNCRQVHARAHTHTKDNIFHTIGDCDISLANPAIPPHITPTLLKPLPCITSKEEQQPHESKSHVLSLPNHNLTAAKNNILQKVLFSHTKSPL